MAKRAQWLSDEEWARIEPLLPCGRTGARRVISGALERTEETFAKLATHKGAPTPDQDDFADAED